MLSKRSTPNWHHYYLTILKFLRTASKWLSEGVKYLLSKTKYTKILKVTDQSHAKFPLKKKLISLLTERAYSLIETNKAFPLEQKGCKRGLYECKDQLLISKMIIEHCKSKHWNISMTWIDCRRDFNSVSCNWLIKP